LEYAQKRLEEAWDLLEIGEKANITIELCENNDENIINLLQQHEEGK
jgi:hypothetical protein